MLWHWLAFDLFDDIMFGAVLETVKNINPIYVHNSSTFALLNCAKNFSCATIWKNLLFSFGNNKNHHCVIDVKSHESINSSYNCRGKVPPYKLCNLYFSYSELKNWIQSNNTANSFTYLHNLSNSSNFVCCSCILHLIYIIIGYNMNISWKIFHSPLQNEVVYIWEKLHSTANSNHGMFCYWLH